jgi:hypothetical protein
VQIFVVWDFKTAGDLRAALQQLADHPPDGRAVRAAGLRQQSSEILRGEILPAMIESSHVLAFVDAPNANVGFEIGLARGLGRPVTLARWGTRMPEWLPQTPLADILVRQVDSLDALRQLVAGLSGSTHSASPPVEQGDTLFLCGERLAGGAFHERRRALFPEWKTAADLGGPIGLTDLSERLRGISRVVWTISSHNDGVDQRDGVENTGHAIVAGWHFGRTIAPSGARGDTRGVAERWTLAQGHLLVLRSAQARQVVDVSLMEVVFDSLDAFAASMRLLHRATPLQPDTRRQRVAPGLPPPQFERGICRSILDWCAPTLHDWLTTRVHKTRQPPELMDVRKFMDVQRSRILEDIKRKTYIATSAKAVPSSPLASPVGPDPFIRPVHQVIRRVSGLERGGDSASAVVAMLNRRSRIVRNLVRTLVSSRQPLILLGEPGTGKTMTLQQATLALTEREAARVFPTVPVFVRLGEFHVDGEVGPEDVWQYVKQVCHPSISSWLDLLDLEGRMLVLFDGMDEMSRAGYGEHTEALSLFARERIGRVQTLFSCRVTDFSPSFDHERLVLMPFDRSQVDAYLRVYIHDFPIEIDGRMWSRRELVRYLMSADLPFDSNNPFVLWLLSQYLYQKKAWPTSRVVLVQSHLHESYARKHREVSVNESEWPTFETAMKGWARIAYLITERNLGSAIPVDELRLQWPDADLDRLIELGERVSVLVESVPEHQQRLVRFDHHRLQEHFAALYIDEFSPAIDWLARLDAPRWAETMVNLVLLGRDAEPVHRLVQALRDAVGTHVHRFASHQADEKAWKARHAGKSESDLKKIAKTDPAPTRPTIPYDEEIRISDRLDLAARILGHRPGNEAAREQLRAVVRVTIDFVVHCGNPITQVKAVRSCRALFDVDLITAAETPLRSPVKWVRDQALVIIGSSDRALGTEAVSEMATDLAQGRLLTRVPAYVKALAQLRRPGPWIALAFAVLFSLIDVASNLSVAAGVYWLGATALQVAPFTEYYQFLATDVWFQKEYQLACAAIVMVTTVVSIGRSWANLWFLPAAVVAAAMSLWTFLSVLWTKSADAIVVPVIDVGVFLALIVVASLAGATSRLTLVAAFSLTVKAMGRRTTASLWRTVLDSCNVMWSLRYGLPLALGFFALVGFFWFLFWIERTFDEPFRTIIPLSPWILGLAYLLKKAVEKDANLLRRCAANLRLFYQRRPWRRLGAKQWIQYTSIVSAFLAFAWAINNLPDWLTLYAGRAMAIALVLLLLFAVVSAIIRVLRLLEWLLRRRMYSPGSLKEDVWRARIERANAAQQSDLLMRTDHRSVGLKPEQFLTLVQSIESKIKGEPALSTYWERRHELEEVLRQERS